ncbi:anti-sigma regulatory factor [Lichenifustis flavocetrariae]|uniref:Anti-sigma regulatory factor n=1 Tax=Lichenifustis flavocetrariae TaxID=2949735 RepID=A0AA41Z2E1_9HYPH|nr:anti-sigma regulatory factor [Lichenifustis flavocetrariae]MCW6511565.1 anti-sigma regulatory factor [Lichenifustis flavocetrariae]
MSDAMDVTVAVFDEMDIAQIRIAARDMANQLGFSSAKAYRVATAVSELANNLHGHALPGGTIRVTRVNRADQIGIEVVSQDSGPGIPDIALAMRDGYSTNRGLGGGLPGTRRLMDDFSIESQAGVGTRIVARIWRP